MSDIVERLREMAGYGSEGVALARVAVLDEAADEIERLQAALDEERNEGELADARLMIAAWEDKANRRADEIERLQALKTPATKQLLNITKAALDSAEEEIERLQAEVTRLQFDLNNARRSIPRDTRNFPGL